MFPPEITSLFSPSHVMTCTALLCMPHCTISSVIGKRFLYLMLKIPCSGHLMGNYSRYETFLLIGMR